MPKWSDRPMGNCVRCYYATRKRKDGECVCARFPRWVDVGDMANHFCGEFVPDSSQDAAGRNPNNYV